MAQKIQTLKKLESGALQTVSIAEADHLMYHCPGCRSVHLLPIRGKAVNKVGASWKWNQSLSRPTLSPSVQAAPDCHHFVRSGKLEFCADSPHELSGKTVEMKAVER